MNLPHVIEHSRSVVDMEAQNLIVILVGSRLILFLGGRVVTRWSKFQIFHFQELGPLSR
jgi:hypothetical protein